jgi:hypothetical protein
VRDRVSEHREAGSEEVSGDIGGSVSFRTRAHAEQRAAINQYSERMLGKVLTAKRRRRARVVSSDSDKTRAMMNTTILL